MCDLLPTVNSCCLFLSIRLGLLFISVLCIMSGVVSMSALIQMDKGTYQELKNVTLIKDVNQAEKHMKTIINTGIAAISLTFIVAGFFLLFATVTNSEGFAQVFVLLALLGVLGGFGLIGGIAYECVVDTALCALKGFDWLTAVIILITITVYLGVWVYFIAVAQTYARGFA